MPIIKSGQVNIDYKTGLYLIMYGNLNLRQFSYLFTRQTISRPLMVIVNAICILMLYGQVLRDFRWKSNASSLIKHINLAEL